MDKTKKKKKKASVSPDDEVKIDDRSAEEKAQDKIEEKVRNWITFTKLKMYLKWLIVLIGLALYSAAMTTETHRGEIHGRLNEEENDQALQGEILRFFVCFFCNLISRVF